MANATLATPPCTHQPGSIQPFPAQRAQSKGGSNEQEQATDRKQGIDAASKSQTQKAVQVESGRASGREGKRMLAPSREASRRTTDMLLAGTLLFAVCRSPSTGFGKFEQQ